MPLSTRAALPLVAAFVVGCTAPTVDDPADANGGMTDGVVLIERTTAVDGSAQTNVSAKFMRLGSPADPDLAERVVGSRLELPAAGSCRRAAADTTAHAIGGLGAIELIDVGDLTLRAGAAQMTLAARAFPDVGDLVSGVFYTSRDAAHDLPTGATYTLEGTGSAQVDRFVIEAEAPASPEDVRVGGASLGDAPLLGDAPTVVAGATPIRWREPASVEKGREDLVIVDVAAESGASVRCAFRDEGRGVVPAWVWSASSLGALPTTATVAVHRVRERAFAIGGLDAGAVRFDLSVVGRVTVLDGAASGPMPPRSFVAR
jgi:hypothetical protein